MQISESNKCFLIQSILSSYIASIKDLTLKHNAKMYYNQYFNLGNKLWREMKKVQRNIKDDYDDNFDELEEYLIKIIDKSLEVSFENRNEFLEYINKYKDGENNKQNS